MGETGFSGAKGQDAGSAGSIAVVGGTVTVHFHGELLPGFALEEVKAQATLLFKLTPEKCDALFSGKPVVLRKGLPEAEMGRYLARIQRIGMRVDVKPDAASAPVSVPASAASSAPAPVVAVPASSSVPAPSARAATSSFPSLSLEPMAEPAPAASPAAAAAPAIAGLALEPAAPATPAAAPADGMVCPNCGEQQPKRTLCRKCGTDMPRMIAAREQQEQEKRAEARAAKEARDGGSRSTASSAAYSAGLAEDSVSFFGISRRGRISRTVYINATLIGYALMGLTLVIWIHSGFAAWAATLFSVCTFVFVVWGTRMSVLRVHDLGMSGWLIVLWLVPVVQWIFSLALIFMPGKNEENEWGERAPKASGMGIIVTLVLTFLVGAVCVKDFAKAISDPAALMALVDPKAAAQMSKDGGKFADESFDLSAYNTPSNSVEVFSSANCPACDAKRKVLRDSGLRFSEYFVDRDERRAGELAQYMMRSGVSSAKTKLPGVMVNGEFLPNDPSLIDIADHLKDE